MTRPATSSSPGAPARNAAAPGPEPDLDSGRVQAGASPVAVDTGTVTAHAQDHILGITVDRVAKLNGFTPEMLASLSQHLTWLDTDDDLWVGVVTFAGPHSTAGIDLPRFAGTFRGGENTARTDGVDPFGMRRRCRKPLVYAVQGITYTVGLELMLAADIVVAAADARFSQLEPKRGLAPFGGAHVRFVQRAGWGNAMYHLLRADVFDAARAHQMGFVQEVVPTGTQIERAYQIAAEIRDCAPIAVQEVKRASLVYLQHGEEAGFAEIGAMRRRTTSTEDFQEGLASFVEKRSAAFCGR